MKRKLLSLLVLLMAATGAWAGKGDTSWTSGDCTVTLSGGTLTISKTSGNGAMADYTYNSQPWVGSKTQITSVVVQSGVTKIGNHSFDQFTNIQSVSLPAGLQTIGEAAFRGITNTNFTSVTIPSSVTTFGNNAFDGCNKLTSVTLPASLTNNGAGNNVFKGCTSLTSVTIPASVKNIGIQAFTGCTNLATVTIYGSPAIQSNAFPAGVSATINLTANGPVDGKYWTTFHNAGFNFQADENTQVFKVELSGTALTMHEVANRIVDVSTPVVLKTASENLAMTSTTSTSGDTQTNNLIGVTATAGKSITSGYSFYVLNYTAANGVGFYKLAAGNKVGTGKAYLQVSNSSGAPEFFSLDGGTTGIDATLVNSEKVNSVVYDLQGRRVSQPAKGLYIVNGKKVVIK